MERIISFGAGIQTTALVILAAQGKLKVDAVIFADTGAEKPETYWYMENYTKSLLEEAGIPFITVRNEQPNYQPDLYGFMWKHAMIPSIRHRRCTDHFKVRPIHRIVGKTTMQCIGFSTDEAQRSLKGNKKYREFPLIDMGLSVVDCRLIIKEYGLPLPLKSSCFFCQFQKPVEWNWLKTHHNDLFEKALALEARYHKRCPQFKNTFGLLSGTPLWKLSEGLQPEMFGGENSCWDGVCGH